MTLRFKLCSAPRHQPWEGVSLPETPHSDTAGRPSASWTTSNGHRPVTARAGLACQVAGPSRTRRRQRCDRAFINEEAVTDIKINASSC